MKKFIELFFVFFKIGAVTFGGGLAMLPILQAELAEKRDWVTQEELCDYYAVGQCTPGIIAVNTATFVGCKRGGTLGGIIATLGVVFPSVVVIYIIASLLSNFAEYPVVKNAFAGIRACVVALIFNSIIKLWKSSIRDKTAFLIYIAVLAAALFTPVPVAVLVVIAGAFGVGLYLIRRRRKE